MVGQLHSEAVSHPRSGSFFEEEFQFQRTLLTSLRNGDRHMIHGKLPQLNHRLLDMVGTHMGRQVQLNLKLSI